MSHKSLSEEKKRGGEKEEKKGRLFLFCLSKMADEGMAVARDASCDLFHEVTHTARRSEGSSLNEKER